MSRKHLASRWYRSGASMGKYASDMVLKCHGCDYAPVDAPTQEQEALFRQHRRDMGESVAPERPTPGERHRELEERLARITEQAQMWHRGELDTTTAMAGVHGEVLGMALPDARMEAQAFLDRVERMVRRKVNAEHPDCAVCALAANVADDIAYMRREAGEHRYESVERLAADLRAVDSLVSSDSMAATRLRRAAATRAPLRAAEDRQSYLKGWKAAMQAALSAYEGREP